TGSGTYNGINYSITPSSESGTVDGIDYSISPSDTVPSSDDSRCYLCHGTGICCGCNGRRRFKTTNWGYGFEYYNCGACNGTGKCSRCGGSGR
ncbi:MAG: hypothetical protein Q4E18_06890, partial [Clostridia bacterium]|nr:hypothetical protein [Clostridia bacterium]